MSVINLLHSDTKCCLYLFHFVYVDLLQVIIILSSSHDFFLNVDGKYSTSMHIRQPGLFSFAHRFSKSKFRPVSDTNAQQKSTFIICTKKEMGYSSQKLVKLIQKKEHGWKKIFLDEVPFPRGKGDVQQQSPSVALRC